MVVLEEVAYMDEIEHRDTRSLLLSTGKPVTSLTTFSSPIAEYHAAFQDRAYPFLEYYYFQGQQLRKKSLSRGQFWDLACSAAVCLNSLGLSKGNRVVHCFSSNNLYDLVFRLGAVLVGSVPITINWQADTDETIVYKAKVTDAKLVLYDKGFTNRVPEIQAQLLPISFLEAEKVEEYSTTSRLTHAKLNYDDEQIIIFTSGTTGKPKGVSLSHRSYLANRLTFEHYFGLSKTTQLDLLLVNPLHHANSSALSDWGMRRAGAIIHLVERYTSSYWKVLADVARQKRDLLITSIVSRHIDFLESLAAASNLPVEEAELNEALSKTDILIGSAPVGPTTIKRILKFSSHLPHIRFGSTETCLQVMATPTTMPQSELIRALEAGWAHRYKGEHMIGYYIGREHFPFTRIRLVKAIEPESADYFRPCEIGEPGYLITQGPNVISYYVGDAEATEAAFSEGWYIGLRDIVFALENEDDGGLDYYWVSRDSALLIHGGAKYACDQVSNELSKFVVEHFQLKPEQFQLAVIGLRVGSEHEDSCCVTIELSDEAACAEPQLKTDFVKEAADIVSKGARPDYLRFGQIPRSFKGDILYPQLKQDFLNWLEL